MLKDIQTNETVRRAVHRKDQKGIYKVLKFQQEDVKLLINIGLCLAVTFLVAIVAEWMQGGKGAAVSFVTVYKGTMLLNYLILLMFVAPSVMVRRTHFAALCLGLPWCTLAAGSRLLMKFRGVPLIWADFYSIGEGASIAKQYLTKAIVIKLGVGVVAAAALLVIGFSIHFKSYRVSYLKRGIALIVILVVSYLGIQYLAEHAVVKETDWDTASLYQRNGFIYSFGNSYLGTFRKEAAIYPEEVVQDVLADLKKTITEALNEQSKVPDNEKPNIIIVQVEAMFDPMTVKEAVFNEDPIPNIRKYISEGYSGLLQVPTIGGSTARTEFEVLAGVNLDYFSPGEIPYNSGVTEKGPIETIAYVLKEKEYLTTAIHNFEGNFYNRHQAFANLGFDRFVPMEAMLGLVKYRAFPEDRVLLEYIKRTISESSERDFIFAITAGSHGPYSTTLNTGNEKYVSGDLPKESLHQLQNYTSLIRRTDKFIGELAEYVYALPEPTILVVYSDHYPKLEIVDGLGQEEKFNPPYFIIDNQNKLPKSQHNNIEAYQLSTRVLALAELKGGIVNIFHSIYEKDEAYQKNMELLQYNMIFGENNIVSVKAPYEPTKLQIGFDKLSVTGAEYLADAIVVSGSGFTEGSKIFIDNHLIETEFIDEYTLIGKMVSKAAKTIEVKYLGRYDIPILSSNTLVLANEP